MNQAFAPHAALLHAGHLHLAAGTRIEFRCVQSRMVLWGIGGGGAVRVNGTRFVVERDRFYLLPWKYRIVYEAAPEATMVTGGAHIMPEDTAPQLQYTVSHDPEDGYGENPTRRDIPLEDLDDIPTGMAPLNTPLRHLLEYSARVFMRSVPPDDVARFLGRRILIEIRGVLQSAAHMSADLPAHLTALITAVHNDLQVSYDLDTLSDMANLSPDTLIRQFRRYTGTTPMQWVNQQRMDRAADLLQTTTMRAYQVGERIGIPDPQYFSRAFKRHWGMSPREFRRRRSLAPRG